MKNDLDLAKNIWLRFRKEIFIVCCLLIMGLGIRLYNLVIWPIFADEAIYIRWSQVMKSVPTLRYLPLTDGKQPLFMWLMMPMFKLVTDPLVAGRLLSALISVLTLSGFYILLRLLGLKKIFSTLGLVIGTLTPAWIFYDRMALADGLLMGLGIWSICLQIAICKHKRLDLVMINGLVLGLAWITKSPALFFIFITGVISVGYWFRIRQTWTTIKTSIMWACSVVIAFFIYNLLRLFPEFHQIALRNIDYIVPTNEFLGDLAGRFGRNLIDASQFYWSMITPPIIIMSIFGLLYLIKKRDWFLLILSSSWVIGPLMAQLLLAKELPGRYLLFTTPPFIILSVYSLIWVSEIKKRIKNNIVALISISLIITYGINLFGLLVNPYILWMSERDRRGHLEDWTSGIGIREIVEYINNNYHDKKVLIGTEGFFGTTPDGIQIYFDQNPNVLVVGNSYILDHVPESLYDGLADRFVFFVINDNRLMISNYEDYGLKLIEKYPKAQGSNNQQSFLFFQVINDPR